MGMILLHLHGLAQGSWVKTALPTNQFLHAVCFTDSVTGWVAGDSGTMLHTTDGGAHWVAQSSGTQNTLAAIFFLNPRLGWACAYNYQSTPYGTQLLNTTDGGDHWTSRLYPQENLFMTCILFLDSLNGWMGGKPNALVRTTDGGLTWTQAVIDTSILAFFPVLGIKFYNRRIGYACGGMFDIAGVIWRTTDGGNRWSAMDASYAPADEVHALHIFDSLHVIGAGGDPDFGYGVGMIRTADGGDSWSYQELGLQGNAYDIAFRNDSEVWAPLGPQRKMVLSMDGGNTWIPEETPDSTRIYNLVFPDSLHGYAIGAAGAFLRYRPRSVGIAPHTGTAGSGYSLGQNLPNPWSSETLIPFSVPEAGAVTPPGREAMGKTLYVRIFDLFGRCVVAIPCSDGSPGRHELTISLEQLKPGSYFYRMQIGNGDTGITVSETHLMIKQ